MSKLKLKWKQNNLYRNRMLVMGLYHPNRQKVHKQNTNNGPLPPPTDRRYINGKGNGIRDRNRIIPTETEC